MKYLKPLFLMSAACFLAVTAHAQIQPSLLMSNKLPVHADAINGVATFSLPRLTKTLFVMCYPTPILRGKPLPKGTKITVDAKNTTLSGKTVIIAGIEDTAMFNVAPSPRPAEITFALADKNADTFDITCSAHF